jgi:diguanylate cyclase (GGDEF)-like protein
MSPAEKRALTGIGLAQGAPLGWLAVRCLDGASPLAEVAAAPGLYAYLLVTTTAVFAIFGYLLGCVEERLHEANRVLERLTRTDVLTRLDNLRAVTDALPRLVSYAHRTRTPLAAIAIDLDHFKLVNDRYGHAEGDELLRRVGRALAEGRRQEDVVGRVGGDEFVMLLPGDGRAGATRAAERALEAIRRLRFVCDGETVSVAASAGVAELEQGEEPRAFLAQADRALYEAKRAGRNQVAIAPRRRHAAAHAEGSAAPALLTAAAGATPAPLPR